MYYLNNFFLFSILGHLFETIIFVILGSKRKSGFLYLWWTPFYGIGVLLTIATNKLANKYIKSKSLKEVLLLVFHFILFSILEFSGGTLLHFIYKKDFWNYSKVPLNMGKYISVPTSLFWAIFAFIYIHVINKFSDRIIKKIPKILTVILSCVFLGDLVFTLLKVLWK